MVNFLIHRPVAVLMTTLAILILGTIALFRIPVALMPDIAIPEITVQVSAPAMSARELDKSIVRPLRRRLVQTSHLENITSESMKEQSTIRLTFTYGTDTDLAFIEVNEQIDRAMSSLPKNLDRPRVIKASATDLPVFYLNLSLREPDNNFDKKPPHYPVSERFTELNHFAQQVIKNRIEQLPEVALVDMSGLVYSEILVIPDKQKMEVLNISLHELESAIQSNDLEVGNLVIRDNQYQYNVMVGHAICNVEDLQSVLIKKDERLFKLDEIADILKHPRPRGGIVLSGADEAIAMAIIQQADARVADLKHSLYQLTDQMQEHYPHIKFEITRDQTRLLDYTISNLSQSLFWGILLAFIVMFFFLKDAKSPWIIGLSIPCSLITTVLVFEILHMTINIISLSGIVLGVGLMVDNSIIVIDNITQYKDKGIAIARSCMIGTNEVFRPLLSSALTTCAVFIPLIFLSGISGALFYDQAMAVTISLMASLVVSVALIPVIYYQLFKKGSSRSIKRKAFIRMSFVSYEQLYEKGLKAIMRNPKVSWSLFGSLILLGIWLFSEVPKSKLPNLSSTETMLEIDWNESINVGENKRRVLQLLAPLESGLTSNTSLIGNQQFLLVKNSALGSEHASVYLQSDSETELEKIKAEVNAVLNQYFPSAKYRYEEVDNIFNLIFSDNEVPLIARLYSINNSISSQNEQLNQTWLLLNEQLEYQQLQSISWEDQIVLRADFTKLVQYNIDPQRLFQLLKSTFNKYEVLTLSDNQYVLPVVFGDDSGTVQEMIHETFISANDSVQYPVRELVFSEYVRDLKMIHSDKRGEHYPINFMVDVNDASVFMERIREILDKNRNFDVSFGGAIFSADKIVGELGIVLLVSVMLLYFILTAQFESFLLPFIVLVEIPMDIAGSLLLLKASDGTINLMSLIGIVVMSGIIINDSILKISTINQLRKQGYSLIRSIIVAGKRRLKPILMTSLTTILALIPLIFSSGLGAELQKPLAWSLIGGMTLGTLVSLYFIPLSYYFLCRKKQIAT